MLPIPSQKKFPKLFQDKANAGMTALALKLDALQEEIKEDVLGMLYFNQPDRIPGKYLVLLGELLSAGIKGTDDERTKRKKIATAVSRLKLYGTFEFDVKIRVEAITGIEPLLYDITTTDNDDWIWFGSGIDDTSQFWGCWGGDGTNPFGLDWNGSGLEPEQAGNIFIDVQTAGLTAGQIQQLENEFENEFAYFILHFGYISGGNFIEYTVVGAP